MHHDVRMEKVVKCVQIPRFSRREVVVTEDEEAVSHSERPLYLR
jgi:hypothetical protein